MKQAARERMSDKGPHSATIGPDVARRESGIMDKKSATFSRLCATVRESLTFRQVNARLEVIRQLHAGMRELGLSMGELAVRSGKSKEEVAGLFAGNVAFTLDNLVVLANAVQAQVEIRLVPMQQAADQSEEDAAHKTDAVMASAEADGMQTADSSLLDEMRAAHPQGSHRTPESAETLDGLTDAPPMFPDGLADMLNDSAVQPSKQVASDEAPQDLDITAATVDTQQNREQDRRFLEDMQAAFWTERRDRKRHERQQAPVMPPSPEVSPEVSAPKTASPASGDENSDQDANVVLAALEEMSGEGKNFLAEMWAEVQKESAAKHIDKPSPTS